MYVWEFLVFLFYIHFQKFFYIEFFMSVVFSHINDVKISIAFCIFYEDIVFERKICGLISALLEKFEGIYSTQYYQKA